MDDRTRKFVLRLREKHDWGPCRIEHYIRSTRPEGIQPIGHCSIYEIFVEEGVNQPIDFIRKTWGKRRFERMVLTDQGTQFYCAEKEGKERGESEFTQTLRELGVQHIVASKRRPTTIGKVERFHRTYEEEAWRYQTLGAFLRYYNYQRPHQVLDYQFPVEVYFRDLKE